MGFGSYLREKREERDLTLAQLADKIGISVAYLSRIERDRENAPKDDLIQKICKALGIDCDEAYAEARRLPPDLRNHAYEVIAPYRKSQKKD
jgi:transcriptional regulator with XRE-family HTH domain